MNRAINNVITDALAPYSFGVDKFSIELGDKYVKMLVITNYPASVDEGWLQSLTNMKNVLTSIHVVPKTSANLFKSIEKSINNYQSIIYNDRTKPLARQRAEQSLSDAQITMKRIDIGQEHLFDMAIIIAVYGKDRDDLDKNVRKVQSMLAGKSMSAMVCSHEQKTAWLNCSPYGEYKPQFVEPITRNMLISALSAAMPYASSGYNDNSGDGYILGYDYMGNIVLINSWLRGADRTNGNWVIFGTSGAGKSYFVKKMLCCEYARGTKIMAIDPEREYKKLCDSLGEHGQWINAGSGGVDGVINPLQVREPCTGDEDSHEAEVRIHFTTFLEPFFQMAIADFTATDWVYLEQALIETYKRFGIGLDDIDVSKLPPEKFPILEDLYNTIGDLIKDADDSDPDYRKTFKSLQMKLTSMAKGVRAPLWNGHTTITNDKAFTVIDTYILNDASDNIKAAQYYNVLTWGWTKLAQDREERYLFAVDEGWLMSKVPKAMDTIQALAKRIRKYNGILVFITQSFNDLLGAEVIQKGQALLDNSTFKMIMGMDGKNLQDADDLIRLTEGEKDMIEKRIRGRGLLIAGRTHLQVTVKVDPFEAAYFEGQSGYERE